ncbi:hypothetical protein Pmar_PMAR020264 [Perkinsus marinus ATCC 50983]|uniref:Uncharacterized protein n=1 Tax=Perkinsus marinus (strain ATCC 50983 / TXsc) TaxID=423536 RepID=C5LU08_PERM5|nr:hypothetical protein Pmar_PMAR020264 [Perkinsus marinus ATCC 50983]EEQ99806.1 hypothetical protein Pmar_PMAR020264 [Perkinsus marinus ATCC 50983]|eukprot:XP_002767089.1 hypothetical protein Pmar_PMAR020264 [Perkinsus marinus ATCC 50983]
MVNNSSKAFISVMAIVGYNTSLAKQYRPVAWLYGKDHSTGTRFYLKPSHRGVMQLEDFHVGYMRKWTYENTDGTVECVPTTHYTLPNRESPVNGALVTAIDGTTNKQISFSVKVNTHDASRECFEPYRDQVVQPGLMNELNELCSRVGLRVINSAPITDVGGGIYYPTIEPKNGTYTGEKTGQSGLEKIALQINVQGGKIEQVYPSSSNIVLEELMYTTVGDALYVEVGASGTKSHRKSNIILEPAGRPIAHEYQAINWRSSRDWKQDVPGADASTGRDHKKEKDIRNEEAGKSKGVLRRLVKRVTSKKGSGYERL